MRDAARDDETRAREMYPPPRERLSLGKIEDTQPVLGGERERNVREETFHMWPRSSIAMCDAVRVVYFTTKLFSLESGVTGGRV